MKLLIEVGAFDGNDSLRYHRDGYRVFTFEPKRDLFEDLQRRTAGLQDYTVIPKAVCLQNGRTMFNICRQGGASSILPFRSDEELEKTWSSERKDIQYSGQSYEVETTRLDTFIEEKGLQAEKIDFIHIDAQGVDLDALMSLGVYIKNVEAGVLETVKDVNKSIYIGQDNNTLDNVKKFLDESGFDIQNVERNDRTECEFNVVFRSRRPASH
jgi:FkbM family methyltransferase